MFVNSDFSDLLSLFNANQVKYMVIGGYAVIQHGEPRFTKFGSKLIQQMPLLFTRHYERLAPL